MAATIMMVLDSEYHSQEWSDVCEEALVRANQAENRVNDFEKEIARRFQARKEALRRVQPTK